MCLHLAHLTARKAFSSWRKKFLGGWFKIIPSFLLSYLRLSLANMEDWLEERVFAVAWVRDDEKFCYSKVLGEDLTPIPGAHFDHEPRELNFQSWLGKVSPFSEKLLKILF